MPKPIRSSLSLYLCLSSQFSNELRPLRSCASKRTYTNVCEPIGPDSDRISIPVESVQIRTDSGRAGRRSMRVITLVSPSILQGRLCANLLVMRIERHTFCCVLTLACCLCAPESVLAAQSSRSPIRVTVCQLENHPNVYDRKEVEVSGRIYVGKFDFLIDAPCEPHTQAGVWLDIGGDVLSPAQFWDIGNFLSKQPGVNVQVRGIAIPLVHDNLLDQFVNDVGAIRFRMPNGQDCGSECLFYEVTATLRGKFFSGIKGGFGMEQCCHLLVVEQVTKLLSKRTSVPAGGTYQCTSERWQPTEPELKALADTPGCSLRENFKNCFAAAARHWGETIKSSEGLGDRGWVSPDMTLFYKFAGGFIQNPHQTIEMTPSSSFIREACRPISPPRSMSDHIYCNFYRSHKPEDRTTATALLTRVEAGKDAWRASDMAQVGWLAYEESRKEWSLTAALQAKLSKCEPSPPGKDADGHQQQWGYCTWFTRDDMEEITVMLHRPGFLAKATGQFQNVPWLATDVEINLCRANAPTP